MEICDCINDWVKNSQLGSSQNSSGYAHSILVTFVADFLCTSDNHSLLVAPAQKVKKLEWNNNQWPTGCPKAHGYVPEVYHLIMLAICEFSALVCTLDTLPNPETQATWANVVWENSWKTVDKEYKLTD